MFFFLGAVRRRKLALLFSRVFPLGRRFYPVRPFVGRGKGNVFQSGVQRQEQNHRYFAPRFFALLEVARPGSFSVASDFRTE